MCNISFIFARDRTLNNTFKCNEGSKIKKFITVYTLKNNRKMEPLKTQFAAHLLRVEAIKLQPNNLFTWASGWKSPFYCDNRKTLSYPDVRRFVKLEMAHAVLKHFPEATAVAGVATAGIPQGALVSEELGLPFCYVRSKAKDHGLEDLISTGGSSLKAVEALRKAGAQVVGMVAAVTYGFDVAQKAFEEAGVKLVTLTDYEHIVAKALEIGYIKQEDTALLNTWRANPSEFGK